MVEPTPELIDRAALGEPEAREALAAACRPVALRTARALLADPDAAEDIAQEAMIRLERALPGFRGESAIESWVYRITRNLVLDHLRGRRRTERLTGSLPVDTRLDPETDRSIDLRRAGARLREAVAQLPGDQRRVLRLRFEQGLSYAEIAAETGLPEGTVASRIFRALKRLGSDIEPRYLEILR